MKSRLSRYFLTSVQPACQHGRKKKTTKNKRGANWTTDEELALIDLANLKEDSIFGKNNGCGDVFFFNYATLGRIVIYYMRMFSIFSKLLKRFLNQIASCTAFSSLFTLIS